MRPGVTAVDDALLRLRRLWAASRHRVLDDRGSAVELASLLVVEACGRCVEQGTEANVADVARLADVAPSTASRLVDTAERAGLLTRRPSSRSGRRTALVLTQAGSRLRERAVGARQGWLAEQLASWSDADVERLGTLLLRFADQVQDAPGPGPVARPGAGAGAQG